MGRHSDSRGDVRKHGESGGDHFEPVEDSSPQQSSPEPAENPLPRRAQLRQERERIEATTQFVPPAPQDLTQKIPAFESTGFRAAEQARTEAGLEEAIFDSVVGSQEFADFAQSEPPLAPAKKKRPRRKVTVLSVFGELLITAGLILLLFLVWQLWWTDLVAQREQAVEQKQIVQNWEPPTEKVGTPRYDDPPVQAELKENEAIGIIHIPRFGADYSFTVKQGTKLKLLNEGAYGHYMETQGVGEVGNFALAAHRQTYGAPLRDVAKLAENDAVIIETSDAYYVYRIQNNYIVDPSESDVILPVPRQPGAEATDRLLTFTTCHPPFVSNQRWIVHAKMEYWTARSDGIPPDMATQ